MLAAVIAAGTGGAFESSSSSRTLARSRRSFRLLDEAGSELARDTATDPRPRLCVCPARSGAARLEVRMFDGSGRYAVRTLALASLSDAPESLPSALRQRWSEIASRLRRQGFELQLPLERGDLELASRQVHHVLLRAGRCYAIAAAAPEGDLDLALLDTDGGVIASHTAEDATPVVMTCPRASETVEVEVKLLRARAQYVLGIWASPGEGS